MQPKTKLQKRVMELFPTLKPLTKAQEQWGLYLYPTRAFWNTKGNICAYCGESMGESLKCSVCGAIHKERAENNRKRESSYFFNICTSIQEFQVLRTFEVSSTYARGKRRLYGVCEVCQSWIDEKGKETRVARNKSCFGSSWSWSSSMDIKQKYYGGYYGDTQYYSQGTYTYPKGGTILPILKRNGMKSIADIDKTSAHPVDFIRDILNNSKVETLLKCGYSYLIGKREVYDTYWNEVKICMRHHYEIKDYSMWLDTIKLLKRLNMDSRNPVYCCAEDLKGLHDRLVERKRREQEREQMRRQAEELRLQEEQLKRDEQAKLNYTQAKGMYFGICISDELLNIEVLKSVEEFIEEGNAMHHCVNVCKYYAKENSLILSAKINGERVETIEVDLQSFRILQSRGKHNSQTEHHDRIVNLVQENMGQIRKIRQKAMRVA